MLIVFRFGRNLAGWLPCWETASHSALRVCCQKKCFVVFYVFSFPPGVYVGTLNLIASIPGPSILTFYKCTEHVKCILKSKSELKYELQVQLSEYEAVHYENLPMQYTETFSAVKTENFSRKTLLF